MSISGISSANMALSQLSQNCGNRTSSASSGTEVESNRPPAGGKLMEAITQALSQLGVSTTASTDETSGESNTTQDAAQSLGDFMQQLFAALRGQNEVTGSTDSSQSQEDTTYQASNVAETSGQRPPPPPGNRPPGGPGGPGGLEADLSRLIEQLSADDSTTSDSSDGSTTATASSDNSLETTLQQSFQNLLATLGKSGTSTSSSSDNQASLTTFLQALSQNLQGSSATGNVINTQA